MSDPRTLRKQILARFPVGWRLDRAYHPLRARGPHAGQSEALLLDPEGGVRWRTFGRYVRGALEAMEFETRRFWTDYPIQDLGDTPGQLAPIRECFPVSYDGDKYAEVQVGGTVAHFKAGYIYEVPGRCGERDVKTARLDHLVSRTLCMPGFDWESVPDRPNRNPIAA